MDVQMPEMSGLEATAAIRERERSTGGHVPIVAMTAHAMTGDRERCLEVGMDAYVSKPLRPDELLAAIDGVFVSHDNTPSHAASSVPSSVASGSSRTSAVGQTSAIDRTWTGLVLDAPTLLAGFGGNRKLLREVVDVFLVDSPNLMTAIEQAVAGREGEAIASSAHALKGSVGLFVQGGAYEAARRLEQAGRNGDLTGVDEACVALENEMTELRTALGDLRKLLGEAG
jgi:two-component system, sensor histidine kinase and response regulator